MFAAASLPLIRYIFTKAMAVPDRERLRQLILMSLAFLLFILGFLLYCFPSTRFVSIVFLFAYVVVQTFAFIIKKEPVTRGDIFFGAVLPGLMFVFFFTTYYAEDLVRRIPK